MTGSFATDTLIANVGGAGVAVVDLRGKLPQHPTKRYGVRALAEVRGFCAHHTVSRANGVAGVEGLARVHVDGRNWPAIGYWGVIDQHGALYVCHDLEQRTWAQGVKDAQDLDPDGDVPENSWWVGVACIGSFDAAGNRTGERPTVPQLRTLFTLLHLSSYLWGWQEHTAHRLLGAATVCPGDALAALFGVPEVGAVA